MTKANTKKDAKESQPGPLTMKDVKRLHEASRATFEQVRRDVEGGGSSVMHRAKLVGLSREIFPHEITDMSYAGREPHVVDILNMPEWGPDRHERMVCASLAEAIAYADEVLIDEERYVFAIRSATSEERQIAAADAVEDMVTFMEADQVK